MDLILQFDFLKVKTPLSPLSSFKVAPVKLLHYEINQLIYKKNKNQVEQINKGKKTLNADLLHLDFAFCLLNTDHGRLRDI